MSGVSGLNNLRLVTEVSKASCLKISSAEVSLSRISDPAVPCGESIVLSRSIDYRNYKTVPQGLPRAALTMRLCNNS